MGGGENKWRCGLPFSCVCVFIEEERDVGCTQTQAAARLPAMCATCMVVICKLAWSL